MEDNPIYLLIVIFAFLLPKQERIVSTEPTVNSTVPPPHPLMPTKVVFAPKRGVEEKEKKVKKSIWRPMVPPLGTVGKNEISGKYDMTVSQLLIFRRKIQILNHYEEQYMGGGKFWWISKSKFS